MDVELTELTKLEVTRIDAVDHPANGFPALIMKGLPLAKAPMDADGDTDGPTHGAFDGTHSHEHAGPDGELHSHEHSHDGDGDHGHSHAEKSAGPPQWHARAAALARMAVAAPDVSREVLYKAVTADGQVDEQPDIDGGRQAIMLVGKLIGYEAQELAAGHLDEVCDIQMLCCAADALKCWLGLEQGADNDAGMLMQSAAKALDAEGARDWTTEQVREFVAGLAKADMSTSSINDLPDSAFAYIEPGGEKDESGKTTPRSKRHFPVHDAAHARNALARLSSSPFGDKAKAKVHAAAKKFGIDVSEDTSKSAVAEGDGAVDTKTQGTGDLAQIVEAAVTKASEPLVKRVADLESANKALTDELAKVKATPVPGGPMMAAVPRAKAADGEDHAAKAAYYRQMAETVSQDPAVADGYRQLARQAEDKAKQTA